MITIVLGSVGHISLWVGTVNSIKILDLHVRIYQCRQSTAVVVCCEKNFY